MTTYRERHLAGLYEAGNVEDAPASDKSKAVLDEMTKDELLEHAQSIGASPANKNMTKDELRAAIDEHTG